MDATERKIRDEIAGELRAGWQWHDDIAEWWDADDLPKLVIPLAREHTTEQVLIAIEQAWERGRHAGVKQGAWDTKSALRTLLGVGDHIDYALKSGGYVSRHDDNSK